MECNRCRNSINKMSNYGSDNNPLCYDCWAAVEKERDSYPKELKTVEDFVNHALRKKGTKIETSQLQLSYIVSGLGIIAFTIK